MHYLVDMLASYAKIAQRHCWSKGERLNPTLREQNKNPHTKKSATSSALLVEQPCVFNAGFSLPFLPVCTQRNHAVQRKGANLHTVLKVKPALPVGIRLRVSLQPFDVVLADFRTVEEIG